MHNDPFESFDRDFARASRSTRRTLTAIIVIMCLWLLFIAGAVSAVIWGVGRLLGVW